jgi:CheY-like chemotaxis protein
MKILIVDDSRSSRLMVKTCLNGIAGEIEEADGAETALDKYKAGRFDLVIMDIHMPRIDGYEAIRRIRSFEASAKRGATPIVALTAMDIAQAALKTKAVGATTCMSKPVKQASLVQVIQSLTSGEAVGAILAEAAEPEQPTPGRFKKLFGLGRGPEAEDLEQSELGSQRPEFLAEKNVSLASPRPHWSPAILNWFVSSRIGLRARGPISGSRKSLASAPRSLPRSRAGT